MDCVTYNGCCGGVTLVGLGQCSDSPDNYSYEGLKEWILRQKSYFTGCNKAFMSATTIECQVTANEVLADLGFVGSKLLERPIEGNAITIWYLPLGG